MSRTVAVFAGPYGAVESGLAAAGGHRTAEVMVAEVGRHVGLLIAEVADGGG